MVWVQYATNKTVHTVTECGRGVEIRYTYVLSSESTSNGELAYSKWQVGDDDVLTDFK
jgi:hypothetical protein